MAHPQLDWHMLNRTLSEFCIFVWSCWNYRLCELSSPLFLLETWCMLISPSWSSPWLIWEPTNNLCILKKRWLFVQNLAVAASTFLCQHVESFHYSKSVNKVIAAHCFLWHTSITGRDHSHHSGQRDWAHVFWQRRETAGRVVVNVVMHALWWLSRGLGVAFWLKINPHVGLGVPLTSNINAVLQNTCL